MLGYGYYGSYHEHKPHILYTQGGMNSEFIKRVVRLASLCSVYTTEAL